MAKVTIDYLHGEMMHSHSIEDIEGFSQEWYGISWLEGQTNPAFTRIGNMALHKAITGLPVQQLIRRCLVTAEGVVTYLHPSDSTKLATGAPADLSGAAGNIMVEIPEHYFRAWANGDVRNIAVSMYPLPGFSKIKKHYISAYEASLNRSTGKAASVVNLTANYRGGNNTSTWDAAENTLLGKPVTNLTRAQERAACVAIGVGWCEEPFEYWGPWRWLVYIEYATRNLQLAINSTLTAEGYRQGGLGTGVTDLSEPKWHAFNSYNPIIPCGTTNSLGNATGQVVYTLPHLYDAVPDGIVTYAAATAYTVGQYVVYSGLEYKCIMNSTGNPPTNTTYWTVVTPYKGDYAAGTTYQPNEFVKSGASLYRCILESTGNAVTNTTYWAVVTRSTTAVNSYRGIAHPFGHLWKRLDGINIQRTATELRVWVKGGTSGFVDATETGYTRVNDLPTSSGYILNVMFADGNLLPKDTGAGSTTGWCDYLYSPALNADGAWYAPLSSASALLGASAGLACVNAYNSAATAAANIGFRLCFVP